jgi:hypothetical protein
LRFRRWLGQSNRRPACRHRDCADRIVSSSHVYISFTLGHRATRSALLAARASPSEYYRARPFVGGLLCCIVHRRAPARISYTQGCGVTPPGTGLATCAGGRAARPGLGTV